MFITHLIILFIHFPTLCPTDVAYRCCAEANFLYMNDEGAKPAKDVIRLGTILYV